MLSAQTLASAPILKAEARPAAVAGQSYPVRIFPAGHYSKCPVISKCHVIPNHFSGEESACASPSLCHPERSSCFANAKQPQSRRTPCLFAAATGVARNFLLDVKFLQRTLINRTTMHRKSRNSPPGFPLVTLLVLDSRGYPVMGRAMPKTLPSVSTPQ